MGEFKAFPNKESIKPIRTYRDFIDSDCQLIILIADAVYIDIYAKDKDIIEQIKKMPKKLAVKKSNTSQMKMTKDTKCIFRNLQFRRQKAAEFVVVDCNNPIRGNFEYFGL